MSITMKVSKGDVVINGATGRPTTVADKVKIRQDVSEFFSVEVQPSGFGAGIDQLIGLVELSPDMFTSMTDQQIRSGIELFRSLQQIESRIPRPAGEKIVGLTFLRVEKDKDDPTKYVFMANIVTEDGVEVPISKVLTTPG